MYRNHLVEYYPKEETQSPMIEEYVLMDRRLDDFFGRIMEQRIHKLHNPEQTGMEASLQFSFEHLDRAPARLHRKRVSNTSSDSGVSSLHILCPAMLVTPDISQLRLMQANSRMSLPSGTLTPIQQFINNSRKSKNK